jgi:hypothetical protein
VSVPTYDTAETAVRAAVALPRAPVRDLFYVDMLDSIIQRKKLPDTAAIETALAYAIPEAFPCSK